MIASGARSAVATTAGLPVDMANTAVGLQNMAHDMRRNKFKGYETGTIPGGSEDIKGLIPNPVKDPNSNLNKMADFGGDFAIIPGVGTAAMKGAKMVGQEIADRVATGQKLMPGPFSEPQMAMHVVNPKLFSAVDKTASELPRAKGTGKEFMTELSKKPGVKKAELADRNLHEINELPKMTKDQFKAELDKRPVPKVAKKILSNDAEPLWIVKHNPDSIIDDRHWVVDRDNEPVTAHPFPSREDAESHIENHEIDENGTHHENFKLPGGQNYQEHLYKYEPEGQEPFVANSNHFGGEPNVLASARTVDRKTPDGKKILHVEEIQSDWHQQGREGGYGSQMTPEDAQRVEELERKSANGSISMGERAEWAGLIKKREGAVPDAPFKKNWEEMVSKDLIKHAIDNGYDGIALTNGKDQADRYGLAKHIGMMSYNPEDQHFQAFKPNRETVISERGATPERVSELVGKELAQKLMSSPKQMGHHYIEGDDIKVGGEGMKAAYDNRIPNIFNDIGKPYSAEMKINDLPVLNNGKHYANRTIEGDSFNVMDGNDNIISNHPTQQEANIKARELNSTPLHYMEFTPEMKQGVATEGLPAYADGGQVAQPRHEAFLNPSIKLANGQVTLDPLEFMPNYERGGKAKKNVHVSDDMDMMRHELMTQPVRRFKDGGQDGEDLSKPAFVYPGMGKRPHQTSESVTQSANAPISALRGSIASGLGFPSDIANLFNNPESGLPLSPSESKEVFGEKKDLPTTTSSMLSVLPFKQTGPVNEAAEMLGVAAPFPVGKVARTGAKMIKEGAKYISPKVAEMIAKGELKIPLIPEVMQPQASMFVTDPKSPVFEKVIKPEEIIKVKPKKVKEPEPSIHTDEQIEEHSFQPATTDEAQKHLSNGHYVYGLHEQADEPHLIRSADEINAYTPDQLAIVSKDIPLDEKPLSKAIEDKIVKSETIGPEPIEGEIKGSPTTIDMKKGDISQHNLMVERGERETGNRSILSSSEKDIIKKGAKDSGVPASEIEAKVRQHKIDNPNTGDDPWASIELSRIVPNKNKPGDYDIEYKNIPYSFEQNQKGELIKPNTPEYENHTDTLAQKLKNEVLEIFKRFQNNDQTAGNIIRQAGWYKEMRSRLRQEFGGLGDMFADLLGATSPNTPVRENWKNALDLLRKASQGDFDEMIPKWEAWQNNIKDKEKELETWFNEQNQTRSKKDIKENDPEYKRMKIELSEARELPDELMPLKDNAKRYGFNGENGVRALTDLFRVVKNPNADIGIGATAPKAITFSGNLIGFKDRATIDVWAARLLQRLAGKERIPSMAESGVSGSMLPDGTTTGQFGLGQDVFSKAKDLIRNDPEMSQHEILKNISDDDLQALVWFKEKELWTKKNWTSASGEGGSFEQEADLAGIKNQEEVNRLRKMLDTGVAVTPELKQRASEVIDTLAQLREFRTEFQKNLKGLTKEQLEEVKPFLDEFDNYVDTLRNERDDNNFNAVLKKPTFDELLENKRKVQQQLNDMSRSLDRYQAGLSIQRPEFTPTNKDMADLGQSIRDAVYEGNDGATVMGSKALSTEGRYGDPERSLDLEVVVRDGYNPHPLLHEIVSQAQKFNQDSAFISKVLRHDEMPDPLKHRPGVEIYFKEANDVGKLQPILDNLSKEGINFYTVVVDGRRSSKAMAGEMPSAVGVRFQLVPEFEQRYGMFDWSKLNDKEIAERIISQSKEMDKLAATVAKNIPGISNAKQYWYDTEVLFKNQYQERLNEIKNTSRTDSGKITRPGERVWSGKPIREGVERATRWAREAEGSQGNVLSGDSGATKKINKAKKMAGGGSVMPGQPRHEAFLNPSIRLANGSVTLNPLEFMPNYLRGGKVHVSDDIDMMRHELNTRG
jgi:hypothetical protein